MENTPVWKVGQSLQSFNYLDWYTKKKVSPHVSYLRRQESGRKPNARPVRFKREYMHAQEQQQQPTARKREHPEEVRTLAAKIMTYEKGVIQSRFSRARIDAYCTCHDLAPHVEFSESIGTHDHTTRTLYAFLHWLLSAESPEAAEQFLRDQAKGRNITRLRRISLPDIVQEWDHWREQQPSSPQLGLRHEA